MGKVGVGWKTLLQAVVSSMPATFTLADVLKHRSAFERAYPNNRFVEAKIRQSLQILRDQGFIRFSGGGHYQRTDAPPQFSPLLDSTLTANYQSNAQAARVMLETWAQFNLFCLNCSADLLEPLPANSPVADFHCLDCTTRYQIKAKNGRFGAKLTGAAYEPTAAAARQGEMPEFVLVEFDSRFSTVVFVDAIPGVSITEERIIPRRPLALSARRAGWRGCLVNVEGLSRVAIVQPQGNDRGLVRLEWQSVKHPE